MIPLGVLAAATPRGVVPPPATDPYWANVVSLLHFDGADGSTTFTDETGKVWTPSGNAQIDTAQSKFGGASGLFDGAGDFVTGPTDAALGFATGDFTIEGWLKRGTLSSDQGIYVRGLLSGGFNQSSLAHAIFFSADNKLNFRVYTGGTNMTITTAAAITDTAGFHHWAFCGHGGTLRAFVDGADVGTLAGYVSQNDAVGWRSVLGSFGSVWGIPYSGWLDEVRVTKGVARYTAAFTPPTAAFPNS